MERTSVCEAMTHAILASVDGTLDEAAHGQLATHLADCPSCRAALAEQQAMARLLRDLPLPAVSADFAARVRQRIAPGSWLDLLEWRAWTLRLAPVAALIAILALLPGATGTSSTTGTSATPQTAATQMDSLSAILAAWAAAADGNTTTDPNAASLPLLLDPRIDGNALIAAAYEGDAR